MGLINKLLLKFFPASADSGDNVGAYLRSADGTLLTHTSSGARKGLDVCTIDTIRSQVVNADDVVITYDWYDVGTADERLHLITYTSDSVGYYAEKLFEYDTIEGGYILDVITWTVTQIPEG